ncbi:MAG: hypothetical protein GPJ54_01170 [Candidatus Heimdallarchaeota archaeon]|nr:hypothetical protein [Candidatus Heimdallarchaeota archaeon]
MDLLTVDLENWTIIKISGPDKKNYLNGIITYDLDKLGNNQICQTMFLTPKSKIRSIFWLLEVNQEYLLYSPEKMRVPLIEDLLKYQLDMNVKLEDITKETPHLYLIQTLDKTNSSITFGGKHFNFGQTDNQINEITSYAKFSDWLLIHGDSPVELLLGENPFEVGLADAITLDKGCFLGQEPLSRMFHRGRPRQFLYQIISEKDIPEQLLISNEEVGTVISHTIKDGLHYTLSAIRASVGVTPESTFDNFDYKSIARIGSYPNITR